MPLLYLARNADNSHVQLPHVISSLFHYLLSNLSYLFFCTIHTFSPLVIGCICLYWHLFSSKQILAFSRSAIGLCQFLLASLYFCSILTLSSTAIYLYLFLLAFPLFCKILAFSLSVNCLYLFLLASLFFCSFLLSLHLPHDRTCFFQNLSSSTASLLSPHLVSTAVLLLFPSAVMHQPF